MDSSETFNRERLITLEGPGDTTVVPLQPGTPDFEWLKQRIVAELETCERSATTDAERGRIQDLRSRIGSLNDTWLSRDEKAELREILMNSNGEAE